MQIGAHTKIEKALFELFSRDTLSIYIFIREIKKQNLCHRVRRSLDQTLA